VSWTSAPIDWEFYAIVLLVFAIGFLLGRRSMR